MAEANKKAVFVINDFCEIELYLSIIKSNFLLMNTIPWGSIRSFLSEKCNFSQIKQIIGYAGIDMSKLAHLEQSSSSGVSKSQLLSAIDSQIGSMGVDKSKAIVIICCEEILRRNPSLIDELAQILSRVGWFFDGSNLFPIEILDLSELTDIPDSAHKDIGKAAIRLRDGDLTGSLSSACGALDSVTKAIYQEFNLGNPDNDCFQKRITQSITNIGTMANLEKELQLVGWSLSDIKMFIDNFRGSLNQAAFVMQKLRSDMGDVHGSQPVVSALVYDSLKWSLLLLRVLKVRQD